MSNELSELNNLYAQLNQISGGQVGSQTFAKGSVSFNDVAWFSNAVQGLDSDSSPEQKASTIQGLVQKALSLFDKLASREAKAAQQEVKNETKKTEELLKKSQELGMTLEGKFSDISSSIDSQTEIVTDAVKLIDETKKSLEEKQKEIEAIVAQIEAKQKELATASTPEKQAAKLAEIQGFAQQIADIGISIEADNENLKNLSAAVEDTNKEIETATQNMTVVEQDGAGQIQQLAQEAGRNTTEVTTTNVTGGTNQATSAAAEAAANAASTNIFTGTSVAPKLQQVAQDQGSAANIRLSSIASNINKIAQGIGSLNNATNIISSFQNSIGSSLDNYATQIGSWNTAIEPVITSIGSFANIAEGATELDQAVKTDLGSLGFEVNENGELKETQTSNNNAQNDDTNDAQGNKQQELETPKFDIKKLSFGL